MKREEILKWARAEARSIIGLINEAPYHSTHEHTAIIAAAIVEILEADRAEREAAPLIRSQAVKIKALNQEVSDKCDSINVWRAKCVEAEEALKAQLATARNDALEEAAKAGRKAVMSFKGKVGGKYYAGYHEDMREYVAAEIRAMKEG